MYYLIYNENILNKYGDNKLMNNITKTLPNQVYHGTISIHKKSLEQGIDISRGFENVDFGKGFYTTTNYEQSKSFAERNAKRYNLIQQRRKAKNQNKIFEIAQPMIVVYNISREMLKNFSGYIFKEPDKIWAEFIFNNRMGLEYKVSNFHNIDKRFDYVYGSMADAQIATLMEDVRMKEISFNKFCNKIQPYDKYNQDQLTFHTEKSIECLEINRFIVL